MIAGYRGCEPEGHTIHLFSIYVRTDAFRCTGEKNASINHNMYWCSRFLLYQWHGAGRSTVACWYDPRTGHHTTDCLSSDSCRKRPLFSHASSRFRHFLQLLLDCLFPEEIAPRRTGAHCGKQREKGEA